MIKIDQLPQIELKSGFKARIVHTIQTTISFWGVDEGAVLPMHNHIHENITQVISGEFELTIGDKTNIYRKGDIAIIPPNIMHGGKAITNCHLFDIFSPVREDYKF
jgi:quercetin dioxygenase-like cupin family protein